MAEPAETLCTNRIGYGALVGSLFDFFVWSEVAPFDAQNLSEAFGVRRVKLPPLAGFQMPAFPAAQKRGECLRVVEKMQLDTER